MEREYVQEILPGDLIIRRSILEYDIPVDLSSQRFETVRSVKVEHYLVLQLTRSEVLKDCQRVECWHLEKNQEFIPFSLDFGRATLYSPYEWTLHRDGKEYQFPEDHGYP